MTLDYPLILGCVIALAVLLYVLLDGFDLGIGILFPWARSSGDRDIMMNTVAPVWDGNETWLVLGGGGLLAAFPTAFGILMPAFYIPMILMLIGLILRGVAFEFRIRGRARGRPFWTAAFAAGSILAAVAQGFVLGGFIQGVTVRSGVFAGGAFDWLTPYTLIVVVGLLAGYALLGAAWLMVKTEDQLHGDARRWTAVCAVLSAAMLLMVSVATLLLHGRVAERWGLSMTGLDLRRLLPKSPIPVLGVVGLIIIGWSLRRGFHRWPFFGAALVFLSGYLGLAVGLAPFVVPYQLTLEQAAASNATMELLLIGLGVMLPIILTYSAFSYWVFRGKVAGDAGYH
jgi:cytochrome d ubiquinol oxidase subunit II